MNELEIIDIPVTSAAFRQLGILVLDASGSMLDQVEPTSKIPSNRTKAEEVNVAVRDMLTLFKVSRKAPNFSFALVTFHDTVSFAGPVMSIVDIDDNGNFDPTASGTGGTFVGSGIEAAGRIAKDFLDNGPSDLPSSVVILTMSDGECFHPERTISIADDVKNDPRITIAAAYFSSKGGGTGDGPALLQAACSDPASLYKTVYDAATLRDFFQKSMTEGASRAGIADGSIR